MRKFSGALLLAATVFVGTAWADDQVGNSVGPVHRCASDLLCLDRQQLECIYRDGTVPTIPDGTIRGTVILAPGSNWNRAASKASRVMWQGKVFDQECNVAVNRFFGLRLIRGRLAVGESWMDGKQSLILDYRETSLIYRKVRDEIRQVGPGLLLGAMYEEDCCQPVLKAFFVLEVCSCD
jgi:hypothetical protein